MPAKTDKEMVQKGVNAAMSTIDQKPEWLQGATHAPRGQEDVTANDIVLPRLSLCQSMSEQRKRSNANFIEGLEEGQLFNSLTGTIYGENVTVCPIFFFKSRIMFKSLDEGGGIICQSPTGNACPLEEGRACTHNLWGPNGEKPECTEFHNFMSLVIGTGTTVTRPELIVLSFKTTGVKVAKQLNALARMRGADMFAGLYRIGTAAAKGPGNQDYYEFTVANAGWVPQEVYKQAEDLFLSLRTKLNAGEVRMDATGAQGDDSDLDFPGTNAQGEM